MGDGKTSSVRWQPDRKTSQEEKATYWQNQYLQLKSETLYQTKQNVTLALKLAQRDRLLAEYRRAFGPIGFNIPEDAE